jgi:hypothetical protein
MTFLENYIPHFLAAFPNNLSDSWSLNLIFAKKDLHTLSSGFAIKLAELTRKYLRQIWADVLIF